MIMISVSNYRVSPIVGFWRSFELAPKRAEMHVVQQARVGGGGASMALSANQSRSLTAVDNGSKRGRGMHEVLQIALSYWHGVSNIAAAVVKDKTRGAAIACTEGLAI